MLQYCNNHDCFKTFSTDTEVSLPIIMSNTVEKNLYFFPFFLHIFSHSFLDLCQINYNKTPGHLYLTNNSYKIVGVYKH